jgi:hypothetical protein
MIREGLALLAVAGLVTACATAPAGPSVLALPGTGKPFDQFQGDEAVCRQWASEEAGTTPQSAAGASVAQGAAIGTLGGAGVGAALGAVTGHAGVGAAIGAVGGLLTGSAIGAGAGHASSHEVQRRHRVRVVGMRRNLAEEAQGPTCPVARPASNASAEAEQN